VRSIKLVPGLAVMAALFALTAAGASAKPTNRHHIRKHAASSSACRVKVTAAPRIVESGESALVFGQVLCPSGTSVANQAVTILERSAGTAAISTLGTATTDTSGRFQLTSPALLTNSVFYATVQGIQGSHATVNVSPKISIVGPPDGSQLFTGAGPLLVRHGHHLAALSSKVTFSGAVSPSDAGAIVVLQRESAVGGEEWRRIGLTTTVASDGTYSLTHTFRIPGEANIRVVVRSFRLNARGASESLSYEISQAQNAALTIFSSANPLSYGASTAISGTLASGANTAVTLMARTRTQAAYAAVATTTTNATGEYTFAGQAPLQNTAYRVTGAGKTSATLFEGVKYALTVTTPPSTDVAGGPLTFTGTVTPAHTGQVVYLQAQNASGVGFHTVELGTVSSGGSFSIVHSPFTTGAKKFRIKVHGDPQNQGVASSAFAVGVTAAPLATLTPEAPSNSSGPSLGQV
jgi:serine protease